MKMKRNKNLYGSAMVVTMLFIAICVWAVGGYLSVVTKDYYMAKKMNNSTKALYLAEAGLERTISDLYNEIVPWSARAAYSNIHLGEGDFRVLIEETQISNQLRIRTTGIVGGEDRIITAYVSRPTAFDWAVFSDEDVYLSDHIRIDSYDSRLGVYDRDNANQNGDVGTNAGDGPDGEYAIRLRNYSQIYGDVMIGPNGTLPDDVEIEHHAELTGTQTVANAITELPIESPPAGLPHKEDIDIQRAESVTISESGQYDLIRIKNHSTLTIDRDVTLYVTDRISMSNKGVINIINNAKVTIYVGKELKFKNHSSVNTNTKDPTRLTIYGTDTFEEVQFEDNSEVYGALYIPTAEAYMDNNATLYGSLVVDSLQIKNHASLHYDEALRGTGPYLGGPLNVEFWQEKYWQEKY